MKWIFLILLAAVVVAQPPSLLTHQFYGDVTFENTAPLPTVVEARINGGSYTSDLEDLNCADTCTATYGVSEDNILRVPGSNGDQVVFYVANKPITDFIYADDTVTLLNLDATSPENVTIINVTNTTEINATNSTCTVNLDCTPWATCLNGNQTRSCMDLNGCDLNLTIMNVTNQTPSIQTQFCVENVTILASCNQAWTCTAWTIACLAGQQTRTCSRSDGCDALVAAGTATLVPKAKPTESRTCADAGSSAPPALETCFDSIRNQDEIGVDCGGTCPDCPQPDEQEPAQSFLLFYIIGGVVALIIIGVAAYFLILRGPPLSDAKKSQVISFYRRAQKSGKTKADVVKSLTDSGWEKGQVKKALKGL